MNKNIRRRNRKLFSRKFMKRCTSIVAMMVVFSTTYMMIMPAIAIDQNAAMADPGMQLEQVRALACSYAPHVHTDECYIEKDILDGEGNPTGETEKVLVCGKYDYAVHEHDASCYDENGNLVCTLPENPRHEHSKDQGCYQMQRELTCTTPEHMHTDECYTDVTVGTETELTCGYEEGQVISPAVFSDAVYSEPVYNEAGELVQEARLVEEPRQIQAEVIHHHTDDCYSQTPVTERQLMCGMEEHVHSDSCYTEKEVLTCTQPELHMHTEQCYEAGPEGESPIDMGWAWYEEENGQMILNGDAAHRICGKTELLEHVHNEDCFAPVNQENENAEALETAEESEEAAAQETTAEDAASTSGDAADAADDTDETGAKTVELENNRAAGEEDNTEEDKTEDKTEGDKAEKDKTEEIAMPAADFHESTDNVDVTVTAEEGTFPEGTTMTVKDVEDEDILSSIRDASSGDENSIVKVQAADITFYGKDGNPVEPRKPVKVVMTPIVKHDEEISEKASVEVVHVDNEGEAKVIDQAQPEAENAETNTDTAEVIKEVAFEAESFSVYALVYTVDFEYEDIETGEKYAWSWPGMGSYSVASIMAELGVYDEITDANLEKIVDVGGAENALYLEKKEDGWYLTSETAFHDTFELKVTCGDKIYIITVTDVSYEMKDAVSSVTADGLSGSTWTVKQGEEYTLHISFEETPSVVQFPTTGNTLEYQLPNNFQPTGSLTNLPITLTYTESSVTHTLTGCTFSVDSNGKVTINLTNEAKEKLSASGDGKFNINITGIFTKTDEHTDFGGGNVKDITVDDKKDVIINKSGEYKSSDNKVHYTVTVKADGSLTNVNVHDIISGTALTMDQDSLSYSGNSSAPSGGANGSGFDLTFPSMKNGETITINYTASVNWNVIGEGKGTVEQTGNTVKVKPAEIPNEKEKDNNLENRISYNPLEKTAGTVQGTEDPDTKIIPWTITVNAQGLKNMKNTTITDHNQSTSVMHYAGEGITIAKIDPSTGNTISTIKKSWSDLDIDPENASSWSYKITDDGNYKYIITYTTEADVTGKNGFTRVSNNVDDGKGDSTGGGANVPAGSSAIGVTKTFGTATKDKMTWTVVMDIPAGGLNKAILVDTLPHSGKYQDTLDVDSLHVEGLINNESYVLTQSKGKFTLTFFKDEEHTTAGLDKTGRARQITVTFSTDNDPTWIAERGEDNHQNDVSFQGDNSTVYDSDKGKIPQRGVEKTSSGYKTVTINGEQKIVFTYSIDLFGLSQQDLTGGLQLVDDYDEAHLDFLNVDGLIIDGIDTYYAQRVRNAYGGERGNTVLVPQKADGKLTFTIRRDDMPAGMQLNGNRFRLTYYLVAKDSTALLQESLNKDNHIISIGNKVKWGDSEDDVTVNYSYPGVTKENIAPSSAEDPNSKYDPKTGETGFKIVINPDKLELNNGDPMVLEDVFTENLSVDYASIKIVIEKAEDDTRDLEVTYDYKGNKGIYNIPDRCKVTITYDARVIGKPSEWVDYGNTVTMKGFTDSASGHAQMAGGGDGGFNIYSVKLYKYSAGHMESPLDGAVFTLVDENGNPIVYPEASTHDVGTPITFTTGKDGHGYVNISLNEQLDGISLQKGITYYLKETVSPASHAMNNTPYRFTISDNPNYSNYEYHSGDIVKIYDWPIMGRIEINKAISGPENLTEEDKQKIKFEITGTYSDGTPIKVDKDGYGIEKEDLNKYTAAELAELKDFKIEVTYADFTNGKYTMADLVDGKYKVTETAAALPGYNDVATVCTTYEVDTDGTRIDSNADGDSTNDEITGTTEAAVTITNHSKYVMNYANTYTNKKAGYDLIIKKADADNMSKTLYGAKFRVEKKTGDKYEAIAEGSVDENGCFTIPYVNKETGVTLVSLEPGDYRISEVQAPANYKAIGDGVIEFTISERGKVTTTKGSDTVQYEADSTYKTAGTYTIKNETKHSYTVTKVDGANVSLKLPGAEFGVWESSYPSTSAIDTAMKADAAKTKDYLWTYTTDENGKFEIQKEDHEYEAGKIYFFKEIKAPAGYELPENPPVSYFYFSYNGTPPTAMKPANLGDASRSQTITNDLPNLEVKKMWKNLKGDNLNKDKIDVDAIDFVVYQTATVKDAKGNTIGTPVRSRFPDAQTTYTIEYVNGNWSTVSIPNAPAMGKTDDGNFIYYTYEVEEDAPEGWVANVTFSDSGREATITNTPEPMEIHLKKVWDTPASMDPKKDDAKAYFEVYQLDDSGEWKQIPINGKNENELNKGNQWEMSFQVESGKQYKIVETRSAPNHWPITSFDTSIEYNNESTSGRELEFSEAGDIVIKNTYNEPYLEVRKNWETETDVSTLRPHIRIYRREIGTTDWKIWKNDEVLEPNTWSKTYKGNELPADKDYEYYAEEISVASSSNGQVLNPNPFTVSYSSTEDDPIQKGGSLIITNTKYDGNVSVHKNWVYSDGSTIAKEGDTAKVILQRALADKKGYTVTFNVVLNNYQSWNDTYNPISLPAKIITVPYENEGMTFNLESFWNSTEIGIFQINGVDEPAPRWNNGGTVTLSTINNDTIVFLQIEGSSIGQGTITLGKEYTVPVEKSGPYEDVPGSAVTLNSENQWAHTWDNLPLNAGNNQEYVYSVREIQVNGKSLAAAGFTSSVTGGDTQQGTVTVTNTEIAKGSLKITKEVTVGGKSANGSKRADGEYTFRVTDSAGEKHTVSIKITGGLANAAVIDNLPEGEATVQEISSTNPYVTMDLNPKTVTIVGGTTAESPNVAAVTITNNYDANGKVTIKAKKLYPDHTLTAEEFDFTLTEYLDAKFETIKTGGVAQTKTNDTAGDVIFDNIKYTLSDAGPDAEHPKTYYYVIEEKPGSNPSIKYDTAKYKVTVSVYDKGDGTLSITKTVETSTDSAGEDLPEGYDARFINKDKKDFEFGKKWRNAGGSTFDEWPDGKTIGVTIQRRIKEKKTVDGDFKLVYSISSANGTVTAALDTDKSNPSGLDETVYALAMEKSEDNRYIFKTGKVLDNVNADGEEFEYFVQETSQADGYSSASYVTSKSEPKVNGDDSDKALNGETIINNPDNGVTLPSTGGRGTRVFTTLGMSFLAIAGTLLVLKRRRTF